MFNKKPKIKEIKLDRDYKFMYENFVISTQQSTYLFLEKINGVVHALKFDSCNIRYGGPNDEARGAHPLVKYGKLLFGFYEVLNSPWVKEQKEGNRIHPRHCDSLFDDRKHYVACFKDVMFEVTCRSFEEIELKVCEVSDLVSKEFLCLE